MSLPSPSFGTSHVTGYDVVSTSPTSPAYVRRKRIDHKKRIWTLNYRPGRLTSSEAGDIVTEFTTAKGAAGTFTWTDWDGTTHNVRFASNDITIDISSIVGYGTTIQLVEEIF